MVFEFIRKVQCCHMYFPIKIESCSAGFSACGGSRSDKFGSAAVRSTRSAFLLYRKCDAISYKAKKESCDTGFLAFQCSSISFAF